MWLHVPSIPFPSVPGTEELSLDSGRLSQLESSVMWKSNFQQQKSWQNVWKKRPSMRLLSGLTSEPSTLNRGVEKWICSLEGSLASPSASPARENRKTTRETSGPMSDSSLTDLGFQSSFLKMCPESSDTTGKPYDPNYERWVTRLRRDSSQRQRQAPLTRGNDSLSWRTPANQESGIQVDRLEGEMGSRMYDKETGRLAQYGLNQQVQIARENWTTPLADDTNIRKNKFAQGGTPLSMQASNWPTPNTMDELPPRSEAANKERFTTGQRAGRKHPDNLREFVHSEMHPENWPTPTTQETPHEDMELTDTGRRKTKDGEDSHSLNLQDVTANWPTPNTRDTRRGCNQKQLATEVDKWPTPNASEHKYRMQGNSQQSNGLTATARKSLYLSTPRDQETGTDGHTCSPSCRRLNPLFAEHLMGLPLGWTSVSGPLEMGLYRQWQHSLSELLWKSYR